MAHHAVTVLGARDTARIPLRCAVEIYGECLLTGIVSNVYN